MSDVVQGDGAVEQAAPKSINITVKHATFDGEIDFGKLTWKDGKQLRKLRARLAKDEIGEDELSDFLDDMILRVSGRDPDELPLEVVNEIMRKLMTGDGEAKEAEKN
jgi:hypothetical protein